MASSRMLEILVRVKDEASAGFAKAERELGKLPATGKKVQTALEGIGRSAKSTIGTFLNLKTAIAGAVAGFVSTAAIRSFISAANEQAKAVEGMETAMRSMGRYSPQLSKELQGVASNLQKVTNFGDEATMQGMKFLMSYGKITDDLLPRTSKVMLDVAAKMGGDVAGAAQLVGKASLGMTDQLRRSGIIIDQNVYKTQGYAGVLRELERQVGGQAEAMRRATGPWVALGNVIGDLKEEFGFISKAILDDLGESVIDALDLLIGKIKEFRESAQFKEWAENAQESIFNFVESVLLGSAKFYDAMVPIFQGLKSGLETVIDVWKNLPTWVQEVGIVLAVFGGKKVALAVAGLSWLMGTANKASKAVRAMRDGIIDWDTWVSMTVQQRDEFIKTLDDASEFTEYGGQVIRKAIPPAQKNAEDFWEAFTGAKSAEEKTQVLMNQLRKLRDERKKTSEQMKKDLAVQAGPAAAVVDPALLRAQEQDTLARLKEFTKTQLMVLENSYKDGKVALKEYFDERKVIMERVYAEEIRLAEAATKATTDPIKRLEAERKVFELKEALNRDTVQLDRERIKTSEDLEKMSIEKSRILQAMKFRNQEDASGNLKASFTKELAEMDIRHQEEIERLKTLHATKLELEEAYQQQKLEKERLVIDQERRLMEYRLQLASEVAGGMAKLFNEAYEISGKKRKELFYASKAAAIAEASINIAQAITKVMAQGGLWGIAQAAVIGAQGALQIARISSQTLAEGGMVKGSSPHKRSDDKMIMATSGEYMQPVDTVRYYGVRAMEALRKRLVPREMFAGFALPSMARSPSYAFAEGGAVGRSSGSSMEPAGGVTIANFTSYDEFERFISSARGQRAVLNVVGQNPMTVRRALS